jgi:hypothetical protein
MTIGASMRAVARVAAAAMLVIALTATAWYAAALRSRSAQPRVGTRGNR